MASVLLCTIRTLTPLLFGFVIGSLISLAIFPTIQHSNSNSGELSDYQNDCEDEVEPPEYLKAEFPGKFSVEENAEDIEVKIRQPPIPTKAQNVTKKPVRPRYYATELGMKDKLFIGVLTTSQTLDTLAVAMNRTMSHHVSRIVFFVEGPNTDIQSGPLNLIGFAHMKTHLKPFYLLEYIAKQVLKNYDWFFLVPDSTYVKGFKLYELVTHMSIGSKVLMGKKSLQNPEWCQLDAGILMSQEVMREVVEQLPNCRKTSDPMLPASVNLGSCIQKTAKVTCMEEWNGKSFKSWNLDSETDVETSLESLGKHDSFNSAVTVFPLSDPADFHFLHKYYCQLELDQIAILTASIQEGIHNLSLETSDGPSWPAGLPPVWSPINRFEMFRWDYFTEEVIFTDHAKENVKKLIGIDKKDVENVMEFSRNFISSKHPDMEFVQLLNGYRRFDPTRGMDYVLDIVYRSENSEESIRRVHLVRPLSKAELVPVPYVTETAEIFIVLPVTEWDIVSTRKFLARFVRVCLESADNTRLIVALSDMVDNASAVILWRDITMIQKQYSDPKSNKPPTEVFRIPYRTLSAYKIADQVIKRFGPDNLYLLANPWLQIELDFLNRVRMNTIRGSQVFFPVPFVQFSPKIVALMPESQKSVAGQIKKSRQRSRNPDTFEVHKNIGHFDEHDFTITSFYGSDYVAFRDRFAKKASHLIDTNILRIFLGVPSIHVMRAVDPELKIRYHEKICDPNLVEGDYGNCLASRREGLASKAQLAYLVLQQNVRKTV